jgi:hypothetical protein
LGFGVSGPERGGGALEQGIACCKNQLHDRDREQQVCPLVTHRVGQCLSANLLMCRETRRTLNQRVAGSSPAAPTNQIKSLRTLKPARSPAASGHRKHIGSTEFDFWSVFADGCVIAPHHGLTHPARLARPKTPSPPSIVPASASRAASARVPFFRGAGRHRGRGFPQPGGRVP